MQTYFYVVGIALVLIALGISFIGMRSESFPSDGLLRAGVAFVALVVIATAYGAVNSSQDEAQKREDEQNREASSAEASTTAENQGEASPPVGGAQAPGPRDQTDSTSAGDSNATPVADGDPEAGAAVFASNGCGSCHTLTAAGSAAVATIGPNLDEALVDKDKSFIQTSIVDPGAFVEDGFGDGIMPVDYGDVIPPKDLADLVAYLSASTSAESGAGTSSGSGSK